MKRYILMILLLAGAALAQTNTPTIGVLPDNGPNLPATCIIGQIYFRTATTIGLNQCNPANTWTAFLTGATSGTVTNTAGALTLNSVVLGNGGNDTKVSTGITTDGGSELDVGVSGTSGILGLNGSTSGKATCTAPAVAGTTSNAVTCTNWLATPGLSFVNPVAVSGSATGIFNSANQNIVIYSNGTSWFFGNQNVVEVLNVPFHPIGKNLLFVTSNFTTAANTNLQTITGLQFTPPSTNALNWNFHCVLAYTQATGTAAVAFGIQAATNAPTNIFASGVEYTAAGTATTGVLATLTTTTATNIVSGTPGATGTNLPVQLDGTLELPASANTINFMVSTATSADAVTVLRGSYCMVF